MNAFLSPLIKELLWLHMSMMDSFQQKNKKKSIGLSPNSTSTTPFAISALLPSFSASTSTVLTPVVPSQCHKAPTPENFLQNSICKTATQSNLPATNAPPISIFVPKPNPLQTPLCTTP